jgi:hypothetical protein
LNGEKFNEVFLFDIATGTARRFRTEGWAGKTAGNGSYLGKRFVATYVDPDRERVLLQVGTIRYPLDGSTRAVWSVTPGRLFSTLTVQRDGLPTTTLRERTAARSLLRRFDPAYDDLDESMDDTAASVAEIANSEAARASYLTVKDPAAGPWHLLS